MPQSHTFDRNTTFDAPISQYYFWISHFYYFWCPNLTILLLNLTLLIAILLLMPQSHFWSQYYIWCPNVTLLILHLMPQSHTFDRGVLHGTGEGLLWAKKACNANHVIITPWQRGGRSSRPLFSSHLPDTFSLPWSLSLWIKNWPPQT